MRQIYHRQNIHSYVPKGVELYNLNRKSTSLNNHSRLGPYSSDKNIKKKHKIYDHIT